MRSLCRAPPLALLALKRALEASRVIDGPRSDFLGFLGHLAQFDWLVRGHVRLLASFVSEKRSAIRGSQIT